MRLLIISNLYPPIQRGGAEQVASRITSELFVRGHEVSVLSTMPYAGMGSLRSRVTETDLEPIERFYPLNFYHTLNDHRYPAPVRAAWHMVDLWSPIPRRVTLDVIHRRAPEAVLTHNLKGIGLQVAAAIRASGIPHVHTLHDVQLSIPSGLLIAGEERGPFNSTPLRLMYEAATGRAVGSPHVVISPSRFLADFYRERGFFPKSRIEVMPNPAPDMGTRPQTTRQEGPLRLLYVGQLEPHKGIRFLLESLEGLDIPFHLHVAGEGSLAAFVSDRAKHDKRITYHGFVSQEPLMKLLALCDATLVPSLCYENSPTVIYESLAVGTPVVASRIGGVGELIRDGENGFLYEPGQATGLREALTRMAAKVGDFRAREGEIRKGMDDYALPKYVDRLEKLIGEVKDVG
ncbi:glycosyltransferase [Patescibacteria group bacterium]|nr:MAG: glycosyltransferase [Patescibacteria group bacterium]